MNKIKIIIVDDYLIVRAGLTLLINANDKFESIAVAFDEKDFHQLLVDYSPDIVLMDVDMLKLNGIEATKKALKIKPDLKLIALSTFKDDKYIEKMLKAGARGFILKKVALDELYNAIDIVSKGKVYLVKEMMNITTKKYYVPKPNKIRKISFSSREKEILKLLCQSFSTSEIAKKFGLSPRTIEGHKSRLLKKTNTKNTINLVLHAIQHNYIPIPADI